MRGPGGPLQDLTAVIRPVLAATALPSAPDRYPSSSDVLSPVTEALSAATRAISRSLNASLSRYTASITDVKVEAPEYVVRRALTDALLAAPTATVATANRPAIALTSLGAGTMRALTLAGLELYRDTDLWPPSRSVVLLIEEPEVGLHPSAQRQVASALRALPTHGVQAILVTHSPVFMSAFGSEHLRIARSQPTGHVVDQPSELRDGAEALGVQPSDILLARRFLVVEGPSDAAILSIWATTSGINLRDHGVQVVPAGGHGEAATTERLLTLAYPGSAVTVVLDNGLETAKTRLVLQERFGDLVDVRLLDRTEIEAYFSEGAVCDWLEGQGVDMDADARAAVHQALAQPGVKKGLRRLKQQYLGREYLVENDGSAIASMMNEPEIPARVRDLLTEMVQTA